MCLTAPARVLSVDAEGATILLSSHIPAEAEALLPAAS